MRTFPCSSCGQRPDLQLLARQAGPPIYLLGRLENLHVHPYCPAFHVVGGFPALLRRHDAGAHPCYSHWMPHHHSLHIGPAPPSYALTNPSRAIPSLRLTRRLDEQMAPCLLRLPPTRCRPK